MSAVKAKKLRKRSPRNLNIEDDAAPRSLPELPADAVKGSARASAFIDDLIEKARRSKHDLYAQVVPARHTGPGFYAELFRRNRIESQRTRSGRVVSLYVNDMHQGLWAVTGMPFIFDIEGKLIDGQHRAEALMRWGEKQPLLLVVTKDPNAYRALDVGKRRNVKDFFKSRTGFNIHGSVASAIMQESTDFRYHVRVSPRRQDYFIEVYDLMEEAMLLNQVRANAGQIASALRSCRLDHSMALDFFDAAFRDKQHIGGIVVPHLEVLIRSWNRLKQGDSRSRGHVGGRQLRQAQAHWGMHAFRSFVEGRELKRLQAPKGGWGKEIEPPISWDYLDAVDAGRIKIKKDPLRPYR